MVSELGGGLTKLLNAYPTLPTSDFMKTGGGGVSTSRTRDRQTDKQREKQRQTDTQTDQSEYLSSPGHLPERRKQQTDRDRDNRQTDRTGRRKEEEEDDDDDTFSRENKNLSAD